MPTEGQSNLLVEQARALEDAGLLREALAKWREAVAQEASPVSLCRLGRVAGQLNEGQEAEQAYLASIAAAPRWSLPYEALALLYRKRGELNKAEDYFRRSLAQETKARTLTFLGDVLDRLGRNSEARRALRDAISVDRSYAEAYFVLGLATREDPKDAVTLYRRAIALEPNYALAHRELGWSLRRLEQLDEAETHVRKAIDLDPADEWSFIYLGNILWRRADLAAAEAAFKRAVNINPTDNVAYWCLADLLRSQHRLTEARRLLKESLRLRVDDAQATVRFGLLLQDLGQLRKARHYFARALRLDPNNALASRLSHRSC